MNIVYKYSKINKNGFFIKSLKFYFIFIFEKLEGINYSLYDE